MKAPPFKYVRAQSLDEVLALLARHGDEARLLAGGQSLLPVLHLRLAAPAVLIDLQRVSELQGIARVGGKLRIGAMTRHQDVLESALVAEAAPLLSQAMPHVAHAAVRSRGTFGGSVALADPAAEVPAVCLALGAIFELRSPRGERRVPAHEFFLGTYATALEPDEVLVAAELPVAEPGERSAFEELSRRHGDYAIVGTCARRSPHGEVRIAVFGIGATAVLAEGAMAALRGRPIDAASIEAARAALLEELDPVGDLHTSAAAKRHLAGVQLGRALARWA